VTDEIPPILGAAGLTGRQAIVRVPDFDVDEEGRKVPLTQPVGAMPGNCRRVQSSPLPPERGGGCRSDCPGRQRNGGCLLDVVRAAITAGIRDWRFEVDPTDLYWDYAGPPIPGYRTTRGERPGAVIGEWEEGSGPTDPYGYEPEEPPSYDCPHCGTHVVQDPANFHFWCPACGKNATEKVRL
jgi:hypothetical protein